MSARSLPIETTPPLLHRRGRGAGEHAAGRVPPRVGVDEPRVLGPLLLDALEVAELLGIGRTKTYELIARGELPVLRVGRCVRVPRSGLDTWIASRTTRGVRA